MPELEVAVVVRYESSMDRLSGFGYVFYGLPTIADAVKDVLDEASLVIFGCGPASMRKDLANACAEMQRRVIKGQTGALALCLEGFGW